MTDQNSNQDRRRRPRNKPAGAVRASQVVPPIPLSDVEVLDVSSGGIAIRTRVSLRVGERLSFRLAAQTSPGVGSRLNVTDPLPILAEVLAVEPTGEGYYRVRCRALLGAFEAA